MIIFQESEGIQWVDLITSLTAVIAIIIAIGSIYFTKKITQNSLRPLLSTLYVSKEDFCGIILKNSGTGPAIITKASFKHHNAQDEYNSLYKVTSIQKVYWQNYRTFIEDKYYLSPNEVIVLGKIKRKHLRTQGGIYFIYREIFKDELSHVMITIKYEDVFGNKMKTYNRNTRPQEG